MSQYLWNAVLKGILEGFTEFLPISSTGHLKLVDHLLPLTANDLEAKPLNEMFDLVIQLPAILAVFLLFRRRLWATLSTLQTDAGSRSFWGGIMLAFFPIAVAGILLKKIVERHLNESVPIAIALIVGGIVLLLVERVARRGTVEKAEDVPVSKALSIGLFQCLALVPGTSRSGATIVGGRLCGLTRAAAAEFSFFLALPTMAAACGYKLLKDHGSIDWRAHWPLIAAGCVASFVSALAVVAVFIKLLRHKNSLSVWGWYRLILGGLILWGVLGK
jgi:undecaprenyl-diphosphatase